MFLVATEDELSEKVACKLVCEARVNEREINCVRKNGYGFLKSNLKKFDSAAQRMPVLVLTDLDRAECAPSLRIRWMGNEPAQTKFLFRVAVREVEAWLLADREAMARFLNLSPAKIERDTETIDDPKRYLLRLAQRAPAELRADLLPKRGARAAQGFGYNARMGAFVIDHWSSRRAAKNNASLKKAIARLETYVTAHARAVSPS